MWTCLTGGLNLRPLDETSSVNVWSMAGNTSLKVGSKHFREAIALSHDGTGGISNDDLASLFSSLDCRLRMDSAPVSVRPHPAPARLDAEYVSFCALRNTCQRAALATYRGFCHP
jgi:hypothetical protein